MRYREKGKYVTADQWRPGIAQLGQVTIDEHGTATLPDGAGEIKLRANDYLVKSDGGAYDAIGQDEFLAKYEPT